MRKILLATIAIAVVFATCVYRIERIEKHVADSTRLPWEQDDFAPGAGRRAR